MYKGFLLPLFLLFSVLGYSQTINGHITDEQNNSLPAVNIAILSKNIGVTSGDDEAYTLAIPANRSVIIAYSFIGYQIEKIRIPMLKKGQIYTLDIQLKSSSTLLIRFGELAVKQQTLKQLKRFTKSKKGLRAKHLFH
jgi:hypothetical protein